MSLKELLEVAIEQLSNLTTIGRPDFRLEQAEYKKDEAVWEIVVSYLVENTNKRSASPLSALASEYQYLRMYKRLKINKDKEIVGFYIFNNKE